MNNLTALKSTTYHETKRTELSGKLILHITIVMMMLGFSIFSQAQTTLIDPNGAGGFESGTTFPANGWTVVNGNTNTWAVGNLATYSGVKGAYILYNNAYSYRLTRARTVHFYRNVSVPANEKDITLSFYWKGSGEIGYDRLLVYTAPTTITPVAGTPASASTTLTGATLVFTQTAFQTNYAIQTITLPASLAGTTFRLIFTWQNDNNTGTQPPVAIDNISLVSKLPVPVLSATPASLAFGNVAIGGTSANQTYALSGNNLTGYPGNISVSAPSGFEVSLSAASGYGTSINVPYTTAILPNTTIYARFKPNVANSSFSDKISNSGGGAAAANVNVTGTSNCVINLPTPQANITNTSCPADATGAITITNLPTALAFANTDNDYVDLGGSFMSGRNAFTMEGWLKFNKSDVRARMSLFGQNDCIEFGFIDVNNFQCWTVGGGSLTVPLTYYPGDNLWHHIAVVGNGSSIRLYIDGLLVGTGGNTTTNYGTSTAFTPKIGSGVFDPTTTAGGGFTGQIMKVGFWSTALSQTQITSLSSGLYTYTGAETGLLAGYNFNEGTGTTLTRLPAGTNGTFYNTPVWTDPFTYSWTKTGYPAYMASTKNISGITSGQYNLSVVLPGSCSTGNSFTVNATYPAPTATVAGDASVCAGSAAQIITFTGTGGTAPYTFTYTINGGANHYITTTGASSTVTVSQTVATAGTFIYSLVNVSDAHCSQAQTGTVTIIATPTAITWNGSISNDWEDPDNWTPAYVPASCTDVVISGTAANFPTLGVDATINSLSLESGASILGNDLLTVTAKSVVKRDIPNDNKWHFLSSPVSNQTIWPNFAPTPSGNPLSFGPGGWLWDFYYFNPNAPSSGLYWVNLRNNDGTYNDGAVNLSSNFAGFGPSVPTFANGKGYLVAYSTGWATSHSFSGALNSGTVNMPVLNSAGSGGSNFNLLGNPYPSSIDWKAGGWNRSNLAASGGGYDYWVYVDGAGNYGVYNSASGSTNGTLGVSQYIAPCQAFFVQAATSGNISTVEGVRTHSPQQWLKSDITETNLVRLKISCNANSYYDEMIVEFNPDYAGAGSPKFWSFYADAPEIYALKDNNNFSILECDEFTADLVVAIATKTNVEANYTITAANANKFNLGEKVMLEDLKTGIITNLKQASSYTFTGSPTDDPNRFHLVFGSPTGVEEPANKNSFIIYASDHTVFVQNDNANEPYQVIVTNMIGQNLINKKLAGNSLNQLELNKQPGVYVVTVISKGETFSKKVVIR